MPRHPLVTPDSRRYNNPNEPPKKDTTRQAEKQTLFLAEHVFVELITQDTLNETFQAQTYYRILDYTVYQIHSQGNHPMPTQRPRRRRPRRDGPRLLERLLDPEQDHPILRKLLQTFGPIAMAFLTHQLPTFLSGIDLDEILKPDHDEET